VARAICKKIYPSEITQGELVWGKGEERIQRLVPQLTKAGDLGTTQMERVGEEES
jgi:hypothetical protein